MLVVNHYIRWILTICGSNKITELLVETIENNGKVLVNKKVSNILIENNNAIGVQMENNDIILAKKVISAIGVKHLKFNI